MTIPRMCRHLVFIFSALGLAGCGSDKAAGPSTDDIDLIKNLAAHVPDVSSRPQTFKAFFAKDGTVPPEADRKRIEKLQFSVVGTPKINGDVAEVDVQVRSSASGDTVGQVQWTFAKENEQWKLKTAPLP
jgi:hypothetical protein